MTIVDRHALSGIGLGGATHFQDERRNRTFRVSKPTGTYSRAVLEMRGPAQTDAWHPTPLLAPNLWLRTSGSDLLPLTPGSGQSTLGTPPTTTRAQSSRSLSRIFLIPMTSRPQTRARIRRLSPVARKL